MRGFGPGWGGAQDIRGLGLPICNWLREGQIITKPVPSLNMAFVWQCTSDERDRQ